MPIIIHITIICLLGIIAYQDFKHRAVLWILFPTLGGLFIYKNVMSKDFDFSWIDILLNIGFVCFQFLAITLWFSLKHKRFTNVINKFIGLGDILMMLVLSIALPFISFVLFLMVSFIIVFIGSFIQRIISGKDITLPLAGYQSVLMIILILTQQIFDINIGNENVIYQLTSYCHLHTTIY